MAGSIDQALVRLRHGGLDHLLCFAHFEQLCRNHGQVWRRRLLPPAVVLRLWVLQVLHRNVAIHGLRQLSGISFAAASYCTGRMRLSMGALQRLLMELSQHTTVLNRHTASEARVLIVDSTNFSMPDAKPLVDYYGLPEPARAGVSYPMGMVLGLLDLASGLFVRGGVFDVFAHDLRGAVAVHDSLLSGDVLVGDRAFCSFCHIVLLNRRGVFCCFRLHQKRPVQKLGIVHWKRPYLRPAWMSKEQFDSMPQELIVRIVRHVIDRPGYRSKVVLLATTLPPTTLPPTTLSQQRWSDEQVAELYRQRWQIETCFAHLKTTMGMNVLKCKSVALVRKELMIYLLVYNLVRLRMLQWAHDSGINVRRVSFIDTLRLLSVQAMGLQGVPTLITNPHRTGRRQLRVRRRRPRHYTWMTQPRSTQCDLPQYKRTP
jgi:hypothetical protein